MRLPFWYYGGGCGRSSYLVLSRFLFHLQSPFLIVVSNLVLLLAPLKLLKFEGRKKKQGKRRQKKATNCHVTYYVAFTFFYLRHLQSSKLLNPLYLFFPMLQRLPSFTIQSSLKNDSGDIPEFSDFFVIFWFSIYNADTRHSLFRLLKTIYLGNLKFKVFKTWWALREILKHRRMHFWR